MVIGLVIFLAIGIIAGWAAGKVMKGRGFGLLGSIIIGIIGSMLGAWVAGQLGLSESSLIGTILLGIVGACLLLAIVGLVKKK
jgi:uncharacterized membrane protein YeaQ/YmgE (transglycosylase-associated protein family)